MSLVSEVIVYATFVHSFGITEPVTWDNSDIIINSNKLYKAHPAELEMSSDAT